MASKKSCFNLAAHRPSGSSARHVRRGKSGRTNPLRAWDIGSTFRKTASSKGTVRMGRARPCSSCCFPDTGQAAFYANILTVSVPDPQFEIPGREPRQKSGHAAGPGDDLMPASKGYPWGNNGLPRWICLQETFCNRAIFHEEPGLIIRL